jgi:hypothetical protein
MEAIANHIIDSIDEIVGRWITLQIDEPWVRLPMRDLIDHLPAVITALVGASLSEPRNVDKHRTKVAAAAEHGRQRRRAGFDHEVIFQEYYGIRNALWAVVRPRYSEERGAEAMLRMDSAISIALRASLLGYHEHGLPHGDDLGGRLEALAMESPLLHWL